MQQKPNEKSSFILYLRSIAILLSTQYLNIFAKRKWKKKIMEKEEVTFLTLSRSHSSFGWIWRNFNKTRLVQRLDMVSITCNIETNRVCSKHLKRFSMDMQIQIQTKSILYEYTQITNFRPVNFITIYWKIEWGNLNVPNIFNFIYILKMILNNKWLLWLNFHIVMIIG